MNILFVCMGNICRSPMAEGVLLKMINAHGLHDRVRLDSAGTYGGHTGQLPDPRMRLAAERRGYALSHHSRAFHTDDFDRFDWIFVMDDVNYETLMKKASKPEEEQKILRTADFCQHHHADHIPDPYYGGEGGFDHVIDLLEDACQGIFEKIQQDLPA